MSLNNVNEEPEEDGFSNEEQEEIQKALDEILHDKLYEDSTSQQLLNDVLEKIMEIIHSFKKPFKFVVDCMISQRVGAGFTNFTSAHYDRLDRIYHFYYPKDKMQLGGKEKVLLFGLVTIFVISFANSSKNQN